MKGLPRSSAFFSFSLIISCVRASGGTSGNVANEGAFGLGCGKLALSLLKASRRSMACNKRMHQFIEIKLPQKIIMSGKQGSEDNLFVCSFASEFFYNFQSPNLAICLPFQICKSILFTGLSLTAQQCILNI